MAIPIGVVLAGGRGRRIGGDKAIVELDGRPLIEYPLATVCSVLESVAIVAKRDTMLPALRGAATVWLEPDEPRHPIAGVVHALRVAGGRAVVVVAGDMPLIGAELVRRLAFEDARGCAAVVPRAGGRVQPLCARYEPQALAALEDFDPDVPATEIAAALQPAIVELDDALPFFHVTAPEDLLQAGALLAAAE